MTTGCNIDSVMGGRRGSLGHAAASAVRVRQSFVEERFGPDGFERWLGAASPELRAFLSKHEEPDAWVRFELFVEANTLIDSVFGNGDLSLVREAGHYAALHNAGVWKSLFEKGVDPAKFVEIAGGLWHKHYDVGALVRTVTGEGSVRVEIRAMPLPHRAHCLSVIGWIEGVFELRPGAHVTVEERACRAFGDQSCELCVRWEG